MCPVTYGRRDGKVRVTKGPQKIGSVRSPEEVVRELKTAEPSSGADYRERSLALHGLICGRCSREFDEAHRHLLTVHHKDGNHFNNPADGSNWENLCAYCHEDVHSRGLLGDYLEGTNTAREAPVVYQEKPGSDSAGFGTLGDRLRKALEKK